MCVFKLFKWSWYGRMEGCGIYGIYQNILCVCSEPNDIRIYIDIETMKIYETVHGECI